MVVHLLLPMFSMALTIQFDEFFWKFGFSSYSMELPRHSNSRPRVLQSCGAMVTLLPLCHRRLGESRHFKINKRCSQRQHVAITLRFGCDKYKLEGCFAVWPDWAIYCTLGNFSKPMATIILPELPTFLVNFCKGVKISHFYSEIISGHLLKTFGDFLLVTLVLWQNILKAVPVLGQILFCSR